jgi:cytochrome P450
MLVILKRPALVPGFRRVPDWIVIKPAVEEILRWVTPVIHFARSASADTEIRGHMIRRGEFVCLFLSVRESRRRGVRGTFQV